jgi:hypothetical protein
MNSREEVLMKVEVLMKGRHLGMALAIVALALGALLVPAEASAGPPANDDFANATVSSVPLSTTEDITEATMEAGEPTGGCYYLGKSTWYKVTPSTDVRVRASTSGSDFPDASLNVYRSDGPGFGGLSFVACTLPGTAPVFQLSGGATYYIQAGAAFWSAGGTIGINLEEVPPPANDDFAHATIVDPASLPYSDTVDNALGTLESDEPQNCSSATQTLWYSFTPTSDLTLSVRLGGGSTPLGGANVNAYNQTGSGFAGLNFIGCGNSGNPVTFAAKAGNTYYFQVESPYGFEATLETILSVVPPPAFDDISNAKTTPQPSAWSGGFYDQDDTTAATTSSSDPSCFGKGHSVWYVFTPPGDMRLEAAIGGPPAGSEPHFTLSAYSGSPGSLKQLACSDDSFVLSGNAVPHVEFDAKAGVPIYLMVGTSGESVGGFFTLRLQRPLLIKTTFDPGATVGKTGTATLGGTTTC